MLIKINKIILNGVNILIYYIFLIYDEIGIINKKNIIVIVIQIIGSWKEFLSKSICMKNNPNHQKINKLLIKLYQLLILSLEELKNIIKAQKSKKTNILSSLSQYILIKIKNRKNSIILRCIHFKYIS